MNQKIDHYIDGLFQDLPQSREARELREELLANLNDRYEDELALGAGEDEAFQRAIESLGDLREALGELPGAGPAYAAGPKGADMRPPQSALPWVLAALAVVAVLFAAAVIFGLTSYRRIVSTGMQTVPGDAPGPLAPAASSASASSQAAGILDGLAAEGEYAPGEVRALEVEVNFENVTIAAWDGKTIKVEVTFHGPAQLAPALSFSEGAVRVASPKNVILNPFDPPRGEVLIHLPQGAQLPPSAVSATSGNIHISGVQCGPLALATTSGDLLAQELTAAELAATSTSGDMTVGLAAAAQSVALSTTSGRLSFTGDCDLLALNSTSGPIQAAGRFARQAEVRALSGRVSVQGSGGPLAMSTTSGAAELSGEFESVDFECTSGNLNADLAMPLKDSRFKSTSGSLRLTLPKNDGFSVRYSTTSGRVSNAFTGHSGNGDGSDAYGDGGPLFEMSATSGGITISEK